MKDNRMNKFQVIIADAINRCVNQEMLRFVSLGFR
jgi:hypothetical protein